MRNLLLSSFLAIVLAACSLGHYKKLIPSTDAPPIKSIFGDHFNSFLFKTNITFDFEFTDSAFTVQYCVPQFNRPALLKTIQQDIEIILMNKVKTSSLQHLKDEKNRYLVYKQKEGKFSNYYFQDNHKNQLIKIEHAKGQRKKTTFVLDNYSEDIPGTIQIQHHDIKLKIELALLKK